jgi:hypothetical protein
MVSLSIYSRYLVGATKNTGLLSKKLSLLARLGLLDPSDRTVNLDDIESVILVFRIVNFSDADLQVCRDMTLSQLLIYSNPCNLRIALKCAISAFEALGLNNQVLLNELEVQFRPSGGTHSSFMPCPPDFYPSLETVSDRVLICSGAHGHTLVAADEIIGGEQIISLAVEHGLSILSSLRGPLFPGKDLVDQGLHPDIVFLLFLIHLRDTSVSNPENIPDLWRDFFRCQPTNYGTLFELPDDSLDILNDADLIRTVRDQNLELKKICESLSPSPAFADLLWAKSLCTSRAFSLPIPTKDEFETTLVNTYYPSKFITTILPVVHFFNHDFQGQCETPVIENDKIVVKALVSVSTNEELFIIYGGMTNKQFMLNYGFFVPGNPYDTIVIPDGSLIRRGALKKNDKTLTNTDLISGYLEDQKFFYDSVS